MSETESERRRRRWVTLGELIALAALIVSAIGVWISWKGQDRPDDKPTQIVEQRQSIPLTLRAKREDDGTRLEISPVEPSHALESLRVTLPGASPIEVGSDGELDASDVQSALKGHEQDPKDRTLSVRVRIDARYVEAGKDRHGGGSYTLRYMWKGGGLFGGRSLHLVGLSRG
jgi:hypothetical protein